MTKIKHNIKNSITGETQFTAEIDCDDDADAATQRGRAVLWAIDNDADLRYADLSGANLSDANLRYADLSGANLRYADLRYANLRGADLSGPNLSGADLRDADLRYADLRDANLSRANPSGAAPSRAIFEDAPAIKDIHRKVYDAASQPNALDMKNWHCGTAHCRAGWIVTLAGEEGTALEKRIGTPAAATAIYLASDPERWKTERLPDFYCDNETALNDMARMAGVVR